MDDFEVIRARARTERERGGGALGLALCKVVAELREHEISFLPEGDGLLEGAIARVDPRMQEIYVSSRFGGQDAPELIAHEIGHIVLHASSVSGTATLGSRSTALACGSLAEQQLDSYDPRERQEQQANVFGRELLLPGEIAWRATTQEGLSTDEIALRHGVTRRLVVRQLTDHLAAALPAGPTTTVASVEPTPDPTQADAIAHRGSPLLVQAGPGTGKTRALLGRVHALIDDGVDPSRILVLTFSNEAARDLRRRLAASAPTDAVRLWAGTFHAFGLELLRKYGTQMGRPGPVKVLDRVELIARLEDQLVGANLKHFDNRMEPAFALMPLCAAVSRAKDELIDVVEYGARARAASADGSERAEQCCDVARFYELYEAELSQAGALDLSDLIMRPVLAMQSDPLLQARIVNRFDHVLVDEYQDVNRACAELLRCMVNGQEDRLWVVGDARQSIYRFRGACVENIGRFEDDFPRGRHTALSTNHRSTEEVVRVVERVANQGMRVDASVLDLKLEARRGRGGRRVRALEAPDEEAQWDAVAEQIRELQDKDVPLAQQAVLCRSNTGVARAAAALEARGLPVLHLGSLLQRNEVGDLLCLLCFVADPMGSGLLRLAGPQMYDVPSEDVLALQAGARRGPKSALQLVQEGELDGCSPEGRRGLMRLGQDLKAVRRHDSAFEVLTHFLFDTGWYVERQLRAEETQAWLRRVCVGQLVALSEQPLPASQQRKLPITRFLDRVRWLELLGEVRHLSQLPKAGRGIEAVRVMTIHGAKGLEFEAVHVPNMAKGSLPSRNQAPRFPPTPAQDGTWPDPAMDKRAHLDEEARVFFVAVSRARSALSLYRSLRQRNGNRSNPSEFWSLLPNPEIVGSQSTARALGTRAELTPSSTAAKLTVHVLALAGFERCPRRYHYGQELGQRGRRRDNSVMLADRVLNYWLDWRFKEEAGRAASGPQATAEAENLWFTRGPIHAAYTTLLKSEFDAAIARAVQYSPQQATTLKWALPGGTVEVLVHGTDRGTDGTRAILLTTGRSQKKPRNIWSWTAAAVEAGVEGKTQTEVVHLTSGDRTTIGHADVKRANASADRLLSRLHGGDRAAKPSDKTCARCPHRFYCREE